MSQAFIEPPCFVTGHRAPDTDSLVGAHVFAWYLRATGRAPQAKPVRLGEVGPQAEWVFRQAGIKPPELRTDCRYTAAEIMQRVEPVSPNDPLNKALDRIHTTQADTVPVVENGKVVGLISDRSPRASYLMQCNVEDMLGSLISLDDFINGLQLECLHPGTSTKQPRELVFLNWEDEIPEHVELKDSLIVAGHQPKAIAQAIEAGAIAVILAGVSAEAAATIPRGTASLHLYRGSLGAFSSRLSSCFKCSQAMAENFPRLAPDQIVSEAKRLFSESPYSLPVVDDQGALLGLISAQSVLSLQPVRLALIDHLEKSQSIDGIDEASILEIIDHHRIGDIESIEPLRVDCRPVGSSATILHDRCREAGLQIDRATATLLLGALVSDTLLLGSPTTTDHDRQSARDLADLAGLELRAFGMEVLRRNDGLQNESTEKLISRDCKRFQFGDHAFLAAQVETVDLAALDHAREQDLLMAMRNRTVATGETFAAVMVTDVIQKTSRVLLTTSTGFKLTHLTPRDEADSWTAEGWVSRKKQLIPYLMGKLQAAD